MEKVLRFWGWAPLAWVAAVGAILAWAPADRGAYTVVVLGAMLVYVALFGGQR
jgi:hypothetical protein